MKKKELTIDEKIDKFRKTIINCIPDHSPYWKKMTIKELDELLGLVCLKVYNETH